MLVHFAEQTGYGLYWKFFDGSSFWSNLLCQNVA
jgi:hypothetical protein